MNAKCAFFAPCCACAAEGRHSQQPYGLAVIGVRYRLIQSTQGRARSREAPTPLSLMARWSMNVWVVGAGR